MGWESVLGKELQSAWHSLLIKFIYSVFLHFSTHRFVSETRKG